MIEGRSRIRLRTLMWYNTRRLHLSHIVPRVRLCICMHRVYASLKPHLSPSQTYALPTASRHSIILKTFVCVVSSEPRGLFWQQQQQQQRPSLESTSIQISILIFFLLYYPIGVGARACTKSMLERFQAACWPESIWKNIRMQWKRETDKPKLTGVSYWCANFNALPGFTLPTHLPDMASFTPKRVWRLVLLWRVKSKH